MASCRRHEECIPYCAWSTKAGAGTGTWEPQDAEVLISQTSVGGRSSTDEGLEMSGYNLCKFKFSQKCHGQEIPCTVASWPVYMCRAERMTTSALRSPVHATNQAVIVHGKWKDGTATCELQRETLCWAPLAFGTLEMRMCEAKVDDNAKTSRSRHVGNVARKPCK